MKDQALHVPDASAGWGKDEKERQKSLLKYDGVSVNLQPYPEVLSGARSLKERPAPRKTGRGPRPTGSGVDHQLER